MQFRNLLFLGEGSWAKVQKMAKDEMLSPRNFIDLLVEREWEARQTLSAQRANASIRPGFTPSIPSIFHIQQ